MHQIFSGVLRRAFAFRGVGETLVLHAASTFPLCFQRPRTDSPLQRWRPVRARRCSGGWRSFGAKAASAGSRPASQNIPGGVPAPSQPHPALRRAPWIVPTWSLSTAMPTGTAPSWQVKRVLGADCDLEAPGGQGK